MLRAADETGLGKALQRHLPALDPLRATWQLIAQILGRAERPLSREGMAQWIPESVLPFLAGDAAEASGRALRRSLRNLFGTDMETDAGEPILTRTRVRALLPGSTESAGGGSEYESRIGGPSRVAVGRPSQIKHATRIARMTFETMKPIPSGFRYWTTGGMNGRNQIHQARNVPMNPPSAKAPFQRSFQNGKVETPSANQLAFRKRVSGQTAQS